MMKSKARRRCVDGSTNVKPQSAVNGRLRIPIVVVVRDYTSAPTASSHKTKVFSTRPGIVQLEERKQWLLDHTPYEG